MLKLSLMSAAAWAAFVLGQHLGSPASGHTRVSVLPVTTTSTGGDGGDNNANLTSTQTVTNATGNWAGYVMPGNNITRVSGSWTVPSPGADSGSGADATWIGIGGNSSEDLIQTGTQNTVGRDGQTESTAWFEMLPDAETPIDTMTVNPGDKISASIVQAGPGLWTISLKDATTGERFNRQVQYDSSLSSAEWIEEDPSLSDSAQVPLDNFGNVTFTAAAATTNGRNVGIVAAKALTMVNGAGQALTSIADAGNSSFTVTRTSVSSLTGPGGYLRGGGGYRRWGTSGSGMGWYPGSGLSRRYIWR
jgi:hypothetical protein